MNNPQNWKLTASTPPLLKPLQKNYTQNQTALRGNMHLLLVLSPQTSNLSSQGSETESYPKKKERKTNEKRNERLLFHIKGLSGEPSHSHVRLYLKQVKHTSEIIIIYYLQFYSKCQNICHEW